MLTLRARILIILSLGIVVILAVSVVLVLHSKKLAANKEGASSGGAPAPTVIDSSNFDAGALTAPPTDATAAATAGTPARKPSAEENQQRAAREAARLFVERYGSFSTHANFENIRELEPIVTPNLWSQFKSRLSTANRPAGAEFVGVVTTVASTELTSWSPTVAMVKVLAIRREEKSGANTTIQQTFLVSLDSTSGAWRVSGFKNE